MLHSEILIDINLLEVVFANAIIRLTTVKSV